jgi:ribosomal protein S18 acetylase RimI-like enzyme
LDEPHVHLGPLAVDAHLQGQGIGSLIMREHCRRLDDDRDVGSWGVRSRPVTLLARIHG